MRSITYILTITFLALAIGTLAHAAEKDKKQMLFLEGDQLLFGMDLAQAQQIVADEKNWEIAYRIDTPSTNDIACRYKKEVMYLAQFYQGRCYSVEKRAVVAPEAAIKIFEHYTERLGPTPEITNSRDQKLLFGRWTLKDREIELTAYEHHTGEFMAIYTEYDQLVKGEAMRTRDNELQSQPTTIDPITGKPVPIQQDPTASGDTGQDGSADGAAAEGQGETGNADGEQAGDSAKAEEGKDGGKQAEGKDGAKAGDGKQDEPQDPPMREDTYDDW